ncbi:MAG: polysaccharide deacetylase family protein [Pseudomonadales bacterium]|nr:polysaccharide deacetylase family protein [Pseudomonadales bacterium]NIX06786.1 polysaccharide deacetylase family protein [Pseudomonadales bacterium]
MGKISLTIDNGPHPTVTTEVLDVLAERAVTATFFLIGQEAARPGGIELMEAIAAAGHPIGNHTWSHAVQFGLNPPETAIADEVARTQTLIAPYASQPPLFRPAGGGGRLDSSLFSTPLIEHLCREGYTCALWNVVPRDWEDPRGWVERALQEVAAPDWSVVVVHDVIEGNAEQIAAFIDRARNAGHEFVADIAPECLPIVGGTLTADLTALTGRT